VLYIWTEFAFLLVSWNLALVENLRDLLIVGGALILDASAISKSMLMMLVLPHTQAFSAQHLSFAVLVHIGVAYLPYLYTKKSHMPKSQGPISLGVWSHGNE